MCLEAALMRGIYFYLGVVIPWQVDWFLFISNINIICNVRWSLLLNEINGTILFIATYCYRFQKPFGIDKNGLIT